MKWTEKEIKNAISLFNNEKTIKEISIILGRTTKSVALKLNKLGYKFFKKIIIITKQCKCCENTFEISKNNKRTKMFCSNSCAAKFNNHIRNIDKNKTISCKCVSCKIDVICQHNTPKSSCYCYECSKQRHIRSYCKKNGIKKCITCEKDMNIDGRKLICETCRIKFYKHYRQESNFNFSLSQYPNEFDFSLIAKQDEAPNRLELFLFDYVLPIGLEPMTAKV